MITYEVRNNEAVPDGFSRIRINLEDRRRYSPIGNADITLWQVERESEAEAAVRRMNWLKSQCKDKPSSYIFVIVKGEVEETIDAACPPPAPKETQLDWNTGEPIENNMGLFFKNLHDATLSLLESHAQETSKAIKRLRASIKSQTK